MLKFWSRSSSKCIQLLELWNANGRSLHISVPLQIESKIVPPFGRWDKPVGDPVGPKETVAEAEGDKVQNIENATLLAKTRELEDKYKRALAETENVRARLTKQIQDAKLFAIQGFCKDIAEIEEILRMATESVPKDQLTQDNKPLKDLYEGLSMTSARLLQVFKNHGLTTVNPIGQKFNPNEHEAVVVQEVEGKESGTIVFVSKLGYKLHDRVIKPAIVGVAK